MRYKFFFSFLSFEKTWNFESLSNFKGFTESVNVRFLFDVTFNLAPNFSSRMMKTRTIFLHTSESIATTIHRTIIRITPLYIPREFSKEDSPRFPLFHYFNLSNRGCPSVTTVSSRGGGGEVVHERVGTTIPRNLASRRDTAG